MKKIKFKISSTLKLQVKGDNPLAEREKNEEEYIY